VTPKEPKKKWYIRYGGSGFYLVGPAGELVESTNLLTLPRQFSNIAFDRGADEVVHDYDCSKYGLT
jgi:hypothetical protein